MNSGIKRFYGRACQNSALRCKGDTVEYKGILFRTLLVKRRGNSNWLKKAKVWSG